MCAVYELARGKRGQAGDQTESLGIWSTSKNQCGMIGRRWWLSSMHHPSSKNRPWVKTARCSVATLIWIEADSQRPGEMNLTRGPGGCRRGQYVKSFTSSAHHWFVQTFPCSDSNSLERGLEHLQCLIIQKRQNCLAMGDFKVFQHSRNENSRAISY